MDDYKDEPVHGDLVMVCADCGRTAYSLHGDGKYYCYRCLDTVKDEERQREIDREENRRG